ncbi:hypothetical protein [Spirosoma profusum]|nr:hypothetical protein [Spirosoma profusum]
MNRLVTTLLTLVVSIISISPITSTRVTLAQGPIEPPRENLKNKL